MLLEKNARLVFAGDSVTDVGRSRPNASGTLFDPLGKGYPQLVSGWLAGFYPELNIYVENQGNSGNTSRDLLGRWEADVLSKKPTWISIMIGINDIWRQFDSPAQPGGHVYPDEYRANLSKMIETGLAAGAKIILWKPSYLEPNRSDAMAKMVDDYGKICEELAAQYHVILIDTTKRWQRLLASAHPNLVAWDRVHPNNVGHTIWAKAFLDAIEFDFSRI